MKLHNLLQEPLILLDRAVDTKEEAIRVLLKAFTAHYPFKLSPEELERSVMERESLGGTSFPTGIAVPHARLDSLNDIAILALRPAKPIPDPVAPIRLVVLMLTSQAKPSLYLIALSSWIKLSQKSEPYGRLCSVATAREFIEIVGTQDYSLVKPVTVEDVMSADYHALRPEQPLKALLDLFYRHHLSYAPVIDEQAQILGEVSLLDVLKLGFPEYTTHVGNLKFLKTFEPFEKLLQEEQDVRVADVMKPLSFACEPSASVVEVSFEFMNKGRRHCPVIRGRQLVGVLNIMDVLNQVMRG